jgi:hypothetical protein
MPVQMLCPNLRCRRILSVPEQVRGKLVQCHHCSTLFRVPVTAARPGTPTGQPTEITPTATDPAAPPADKSAA